MSENNGVVITPVNTVNVGGSGGSGTGSANFAVSNVLDVQGKVINSIGDLTLSSSITTVSGNLNVLGTINAPVSGAAPTGSLNYFVTNQLDVRGYLTNSIGNATVVSGNLQVLGALFFNSSSLTGSGATFTSSGSYLLTASFNPFSASVNAFSASILTWSGSVNTFSASVNAFTSSQATTNTSNTAQLAALNVFTGSATTSFTSFNTFSASVNSFTSSQTTTNASTAATLTAHNTFSASVNTFTASADTRYVMTASFTSGTIIPLLTGNFDTRYAALGGGSFTGSGSYLLTASFTSGTIIPLITGNLDTRYAAFGSGGTFTASGSYLLTASFNPFSASVNAFTASILTWSGSVNAFTASQTATNTSTAATLTGLATFSASVNSFSASMLSYTGSVNIFSASILNWSSSLTANYDLRYVTTSSFTNARVVSMVTGTLDTRYSGSGGAGGSGSTTLFTASILLSESLAPTSASGYGELWVTSSLPHNLYFQDSRGSITPAAGYDPMFPRIIEEEFLASNNNGNNMVANGLYWPYFSINGTGTSFGFAPAQTSVVGHPGIGQLSTGTTATGYTELYMNPQAIRAGAGEIDLTWIVEIPTLSDGTNTFTVFAGLGNTATGGTVSQAIYFNYGSAVNAGKWQCNTVGTTADSGITVVAGTWYTLRILFDSAGVNAYFFINGVLVATINTNTPNGNCGPMLYILKSLGTTSRTMMVDYMGLKLSGMSRA